MELYKIILLFTSPIFVGIVVNEYRRAIFQIIKQKTFDYDIVVGILSARSNFDHRNAIRNTWLKYIMGNSSLKDRVIVKFIVGDRACDVHPADRMDEFSCKRWNVSAPDQTENIAVVSLGDKISHDRQNEKENVDGEAVYPVSQISFKVHHPVVIQKLGILKSLLEENTEVKIALYDGPSQVEIVKAIITDNNTEVEVDGFVYKTIDPYILPKDFEGQIVGKYTSEFGRIHTSKYKYNEGGGAISAVKSPVAVNGHYRNPRELIFDKVPGVSFVYSIHEPDALLRHISQTSQRDHQWMSNLIDKELKLREEIDQNDDVLLVDMVDVYRNIPQKLLLFHQWAMKSVNFKFLLKTDDDCYVDLERILHAVEKWKDRKKLWWGRFRHNWAVEHYGKWAEHSYQSPAYPAFACGSGNVLGKDLVQWTVSNIEDLNLYQGEDVSLGIWLSAVKPHMIDDPLWQCESECISNMYTMPDLTPQHLQYYWDNKLRCSDPCGCD